MVPVSGYLIVTTSFLAVLKNYISREVRNNRSHNSLRYAAHNNKRIPDFTNVEEGGFESNALLCRGMNAVQNNDNFEEI